MDYTQLTDMQIFALINNYEMELQHYISNSRDLNMYREELRKLQAIVKERGIDETIMM